ncbi:MAG: hypothetical protein ACRC0G_08790 [Fusobacteriaceae bacterium]
MRLNISRGVVKAYIGKEDGEDELVSVLSAFKHYDKAKTFTLEFFSEHELIKVFSELDMNEAFACIPNTVLTTSNIFVFEVGDKP